MFCRSRADHRVIDVVTAMHCQERSIAVKWIRRTFDSTKRFMVARISWWPETSSSVFGRYFSTLYLVSKACKAAAKCVNQSLRTKEGSLLPLPGGLQHFFFPSLNRSSN